jgi:hypothetical protein
LLLCGIGLRIEFGQVAATTPEPLQLDLVKECSTCADADFHEYLIYVCTAKRWDAPRTVDDALRLYFDLTSLIRQQQQKSATPRTGIYCCLQYGHGRCWFSDKSVAQGALRVVLHLPSRIIYCVILYSYIKLYLGDKSLVLSQPSLYTLDLNVQSLVNLLNNIQSNLCFQQFNVPNFMPGINLALLCTL